MKIRYLLILLPFILCNCGSPQDNIVHQFQAVTDTLEQQTSRAGHGELNDFKCISDHIVGEDTVYMVAAATVAYLDSLIEQVTGNKDANGNTPAFIYNIQTEHRINSIFLEANKTFVAGLRYKKENKSVIDSMMQTELDYTRHKGWTTEEFKDVPSYVTVTQLNKFKADCTKAANITISDMETYYRMVRSSVTPAPKQSK